MTVTTENRPAIARDSITIEALGAEILQQQERKRDYRVDSRNLRPHIVNDDLRFTFETADREIQLAPNRVFNQQVSDRTGIPIKYYDRLHEGSAQDRMVLADNIRHWFETQPKTRLVRTFDPNEGIFAPSTGRAFLSDGYRTLDNFDLMEKLMPVAFDSGLEVKSCQVTESRLYLQLVTPKLEALINPNVHTRANDIVQGGLIISNSEVGAGALKIQELIYRLVCRNGLVVGEGLRQFHTGGRGDDLSGFYGEETKRVTDEAFWRQAQDVMQGMLTEGNFRKTVDRMNEASGEEIKNPLDATEVVTKRFGLTNDEKAGFLANLVNGGDLSRMGAVNAVTALAHDAPTYDRAVEFEVLGGRLLTDAAIQLN